MDSDRIADIQVAFAKGVHEATPAQVFFALNKFFRRRAPLDPVEWTRMMAEFTDCLREAEKLLEDAKTLRSMQ